MRIHKRFYHNNSEEIISEYEFKQIFKDSWVKPDEALKTLIKEKSFSTGFCEYYI